MDSPRDPRNRLPTYLAKFCPDPEIVKKKSRLWAVSFLHFLKRLSKACVIGWTALDWSSRLFLALSAGAVLLLVVIPSVIFWCLIIAALLVFFWRIQVLDRTGKILLACGGFTAFVLLAIGINRLVHKPDNAVRNGETGRVESLKQPYGRIQEPDHRFERDLVPHIADETKMSHLREAPESFVGKVFILCGNLWQSDDYSNNANVSLPYKRTGAAVAGSQEAYSAIADYYNSELRRQSSIETTHYVFKFCERGKTWQEIGIPVSAYLPRDIGRRIADRFVKTKELGGKSPICRVKATILVDSRLDCYVIEIRDVQFLNETSDGWEPWILDSGK